MKKCYLLVYSSTAATPQKMKEILNSISEVSTWRTDVDYTFFIVSEVEASTLSELIRSRTGEQGRFLVSEINDNRQGWLTPESWYLLKHKELKPKPKAT